LPMDGPAGSELLPHSAPTLRRSTRFRRCPMFDVVEILLEMIGEIVHALVAPLARRGQQEAAE
jgi:hypothetical protein